MWRGIKGFTWKMQTPQQTVLRRARQSSLGLLGDRWMRWCNVLLRLRRAACHNIALEGRNTVHRQKEKALHLLEDSRVAALSYHYQECEAKRSVTVQDEFDRTEGQTDVESSSREEDVVNSGRKLESTRLYYTPASCKTSIDWFPFYPLWAVLYLCPGPSVNF